MAVHQTARESLTQYFTLVAALLAIFLITSIHLTRESLWDDEGYTMGIIRDSSAPPESLRASLQFIFSSLSNTLMRVRTVDVHPPLYYVTLDAWTLVAGHSIYAVRLYSALWGLIALVATYAAGRRLFQDHRLAVIAVLTLGTASFFVYYTREARMYTMLMALAALSMWAYARWMQQQTVRRALLYGVLMALLLYTHYAAVFVILAQVIHWLIFVKKGNLRVTPAFFRALIPYTTAILVFALWVPSALAQYRIHGGPGGLPLASDWNTVAALLVLLTNGYVWFYAIIVILTFVYARHYQNSLSLVILWMVVLPVALLLFNGAVRPMFQMRYIIPILPAFALLIALGIQNLFSLRFFTPFRTLRFVLLAFFLYLQLSTYSWFWPNKPTWENSVQQMVTERKLLEPAITSISPYSPTAYYGGVRQGISLDLSWRWQESYEMHSYVETMRESLAVWVVMPSSFSSTWDAVADLMADGRGVGYRDTMINMIFYRFDQDRGDNLQFHFGDTLAWKGGIGHQLYALAGEPFCFGMNFEALRPINGDYSVDVALTQGYNTRRAEQQLTLDSFDTGDEISLSPCITIPAANPPGPHHLRVRVLYNGAPLMLLESENLYWSEELMPALVSVE